MLSLSSCVDCLFVLRLMPGITERAIALRSLYHARKRILMQPVISGATCSLFDCLIRIRSIPTLKLLMKKWRRTWSTRPQFCRDARSSARNVIATKASMPTPIFRIGFPNKNTRHLRTCLAQASCSCVCSLFLSSLMRY